ncbi:hypothetical protein H7683_18925 [Ectopseudomonas mendocina]|uniref:hypothetical protein n=1 Tax=Ectopseudomonas mendocina TaxID=300 RepID=UPI001ADFD0D8|nr:hypothetical protein [Pseudomonas mendocina]QTN45041.1 hypothetical protein H7683_18925 [Pseudomonas mendocina]
MSIALGRTKSDADLMSRSGYAIDAIAKLLAENSLKRAEGNSEGLMDGYQEGGLLEAIKLIGRGLCVAGEDLQALIEQVETEAHGGAQ